MRAKIFTEKIVRSILQIVFSWDILNSPTTWKATCRFEYGLSDEVGRIEIE